MRAAHELTQEQGRGLAVMRIALALVAGVGAERDDRPVALIEAAASRELARELDDPLPEPGVGRVALALLELREERLEGRLLRVELDLFEGDFRVEDLQLEILRLRLPRVRRERELAELVLRQGLARGRSVLRRGLLPRVAHGRARGDPPARAPLERAARSSGAREAVGLDGQDLDQGREVHGLRRAGEAEAAELARGELAGELVEDAPSEAHAREAHASLAHLELEGTGAFELGAERAPAALEDLPQPAVALRVEASGLERAAELDEQARHVGRGARSLSCPGARLVHGSLGGPVPRLPHRPAELDP